MLINGVNVQDKVWLCIAVQSALHFSVFPWSLLLQRPKWTIILRFPNGTAKFSISLYFLDLRHDEAISFGQFDLQSQKRKVVVCGVGFVGCYIHMPAGSESY